MKQDYEAALTQQLAQIGPLDQRAMEEAQRRWDSIAHPLNSLGLLERDIVHIAGITGSADMDLSKKAVVVMCADNGVVAQGVTQTGQDVTAIVTENMSKGDTSVCCMSRVAGAEVIPVDIGVAKPVTGARIRQKCVRRGTADMTQGPAMTREEAAQAVMTGLELVGELKEAGYRILATGEMGIGNTTTTAAVAAALLGRSPEETVGRGAGLSDGGLVRKRRAVAAALAVNQPDPTDPMDVLCKVGGLDIAAMTGFYLGCAFQKLPVLLDGAISCAAALCAVRLCPWAEKSLLASHRPAEPCGQLLLDALGLEPVLDAGLRLGEGTGAAAAMPLLDMALSVYGEMHTFGGLGIPAYRADGRSPEEGEL